MRKHGQTFRHGQAMVEYLMLLIAVAVVVAVATSAFFSQTISARRSSSSVFGQYYQRLANDVAPQARW